MSGLGTLGHLAPRAFVWLAWALVLLITSFSAQASERIACVQHQLHSLGYDTGSASGKINGQTRAAARAAFGDLGARLGLELPFKDRTAGQWCRALGLNAPHLQQFWPSQQALKVYTDASDSAFKRQLLNALFEQSRAFLSDQFGQQLAGSFALIGTDQPTSLTAALNTALQERGRPARKRPLPICTDRDSGGVANRGFVALCWRAPTAYSAQQVAKLLAEMAPTMVHEHVHQLQYERARDVPAQADGTGQQLLGPAWMIEGSAELIEAQFRATGQVRTAGQTLFEMQKPARRARVTLTKLRDAGAVQTGQDYGTSRFAAHLLAQRFGVSQLFSYFDALGLLKNQEAAFELAFGLQMAQFEAEFEGLRRDFGAARRWIEEPTQ